MNATLSQVCRFIEQSFSCKCRECGRQCTIAFVPEPMPGDDLQDFEVRVRCLHGLHGPSAFPAMASRVVTLSGETIRRLPHQEVAAYLVNSIPRAIGWPTPPPGPEVP